jgi:hypothetical protein
MYFHARTLFLNKAGSITPLVCHPALLATIRLTQENTIAYLTKKKLLMINSQLTTLFVTYEWAH